MKRFGNIIGESIIVVMFLAITGAMWFGAYWLFGKTQYMLGISSEWLALLIGGSYFGWICYRLSTRIDQLQGTVSGLKYDLAQLKGETPN